MYTIELVTFDIAGTTMQDKNMVEKAFTTAFEVHDIPATYEELIPYRGTAKRPIVEAMVARHRPEAGPDLIDRAMQTFIETLDGLMPREAEPVPGAEQAFRWLRERGIKAALTTGFDLHIKALALESLGWGEELIDAAVCSDEVPRGRPAPWMIYKAMQAVGVQDVGKVMAIGDTPRDLEAGTRAGCAGVVGVLTGSHDAVSLGRHRHSHIIPSVADLPALMDEEFTA